MFAVTNMDNKWLIRLIYVLSLATFILIVLVGYLAFTNQMEINRLKQSVQEIQSKAQAVPVNGKDGPAGYTPIKNVDYFDGAKGDKGDRGMDGQNSISTQTVTVQEKPIPGEKGDAGPPGLSLDMMVDPVTCLLMTRYQGDTSWSIQAQLPIPCEVL